jgi:hypothetical protein
MLAAHCLQNKKEPKTKEAFESYFLFKNDYDESGEVDDGPAKADIFEFIVHPDWDPKDPHSIANIAIAVLEKPMKLSNGIRHICLNTPSNPIQSFDGKIGKVYGWGLMEDHSLVSELGDVEVPLVDQALCNNSSSRTMSGTSFCAGVGDRKTGACNGNV